MRAGLVTDFLPWPSPGPPAGILTQQVVVTATGSPLPTASPGDVWASRSNTTGRYYMGGNTGTSPANASVQFNGTNVQHCIGTTCQSVAPFTAYDATVLAEPSATHYWKLNDTGALGPNSDCPATFADSISSGATAVPSPVPLGTSSPGPQNCGEPSIVKDGSGAAAFQSSDQGGTASGWLTIAAGTTPAVAGGFTVECIISGTAGVGNSSAQYWFTNDAGNGINIGTVAAQTSVNVTNWHLQIGGTSNTLQASFPNMVALDVVYKWDGTSNWLYANDSLIYKSSTNTPGNAGTLGKIGSIGTAATIFDGRIQKCSTYNTALSETKIRAHFLASGL